ncbi:MAG: hypothetical protein ACI9K2_005247, partial [Myxococcota bacterium]
QCRFRFRFRFQCRFRFRFRFQCRFRCPFRCRCRWTFRRLPYRFRSECRCRCPWMFRRLRYRCRYPFPFPCRSRCRYLYPFRRWPCPSLCLRMRSLRSPTLRSRSLRSRSLRSRFRPWPCRSRPSCSQSLRRLCPNHRPAGPAAPSTASRPPCRGMVADGDAIGGGTGDGPVPQSPSSTNHSPNRSPSINVGRCVLLDGTVGNRLASATRSPSTPSIRPRASVASPIGTVPHGW